MRMMIGIVSSVFFFLAMQNTLLAQSKTQGPSQAEATEDRIAALIAALDDPDRIVRRRAVEELSGLGAEAESAIPALTKAAAGDEDADVRGESCMALGQIGRQPKTVMPVLIEALQDRASTTSGRPVLIFAGWGLGAFGGDAVAHLLPLLSSDDNDEFKAAALGLSRVGPAAKAAVPLLIESLKKEDSDHQIYSINALKEIGPEAKAAVPELMAALANDNFHVRYWACRALGQMGAHAVPAVPTLLRLLQQDVSSVRRNAAAALGNIGPAIGQRAVPPLINALQDANQIVREDVVIALGKLGPLAKPAIPVLQAALDDRSLAARAQAAKTLWLLSGDAQQANTILLQELQSDQKPWEAAQVLGEIAPQTKAVEAVVGVLKSDQSLTRQCAAEALGQMGVAASTALPTLEQLAADDPDEEVRQAAGEAVRQIQRQQRSQSSP